MPQQSAASAKFTDFRMVDSTIGRLEVAGIPASNIVVRDNGRLIDDADRTAIANRGIAIEPGLEMAEHSIEVVVKVDEQHLDKIEAILAGEGTLQNPSAH